LNQRPLGYEPNELPGCSTPHLQFINTALVGVNSEPAHSAASIRYTSCRIPVAQARKHRRCPQLYVAFVLAVDRGCVAGGRHLSHFSASKPRPTTWSPAVRSQPIVLVLTLLTSWIGAGSLFAGAENAYRNGFAALWQRCRGLAGPTADLLHRAPRPQIRAVHFARPARGSLQPGRARVLGTIAILFAYVGITSYQFKGGGNVLHLIFPSTASPRSWAPISLPRSSSSPPHMAGMSSVAYMDVAIGSLVTVICVMAAPMLFFKAGGWAGLHSALPRILPGARQLPIDSMCVRQSAPWVFSALLEFLVPVLLLMLGNQVMYQKFFSAAKSEKDARLSVVGWILGTVLLETLIVAIAVFGSCSLSHWRSSPAILT
jgi:SSS family solute:Na+ symporter